MQTVEVLQSLWLEGDARVSGVKFAGDQGSIHLRLLLHGLEVTDRGEIPDFKSRLIRIVAEATSKAGSSDSRELWISLSTRPELAEHFAFDAGELARMGVLKVVVLDNHTGYTL